MKTRKSLIIILIVVLLAAYYLLGTDYLKQHRENGALASQTKKAEQTLAQIPHPPDDLAQQLASAQASLEAIKNSLPPRMSSTVIINTILKLADECQVKAIPLITQAWTTEEYGDYSYDVFRLNVAVTGTFLQLTNFASELENGELKTLTLENLSIARAPEQPEIKNSPEVTLVNASLNLAVYTRTPVNE